VRDGPEHVGEGVEADVVQPSGVARADGAGELPPEGRVRPAAFTPTRTGALRLTGAGSAALAERVEGEIRGGDLTGGPSYMTALAYLSIMPARRAAQALRTRAAAAADEAGRLEEVLERAGGSEVHMIEVHYLITRLKHDGQWLTATARRIEAGELAWP
jgi:hypothetical protein